MTQQGGKVYYLPLQPAGKSAIRVFHQEVPLHEAFARTQIGKTESQGQMEKLEIMVSEFTIRSSSALDAAILAHAKRFQSGYYHNEDHDKSEQRRQIVLLSMSIYLQVCISKSWETVRATRDSHRGMLFEIAFEPISTLLGSKYFTLFPGEVHAEFTKLQPLLNSSLKACGQETKISSYEDIIESHVHIMIERTKEQFKRLSEAI